MGSVADSLNEHLDRYEPEPEQFVVDSPERADWCLRKLAKIRGEYAEAKALAEKEIARITEWLEIQEIRANRDAEYFENALAIYHHQQLAADPKAKTISLPHGTLKARQQPDQWAVDEAAFLAWAREDNDGWIRVKEEPDKAFLKKVALVVNGKAIHPATGEEIPGITVSPGGVRYTAEVA